jgi:hypothetical protein
LEPVIAHLQKLCNRRCYIRKFCPKKGGENTDLLPNPSPKTNFSRTLSFEDKA